MNWREVARERCIPRYTVDAKCPRARFRGTGLLERKFQANSRGIVRLYLFRVSFLPYLQRKHSGSRGEDPASRKRCRGMLKPRELDASCRTELMDRSLRKLLLTSCRSLRWQFRRFIVTQVIDTRSRVGFGFAVANTPRAGNKQQHPVANQRETRARR